jgi:glycosyltransferase involved in cell wall biosynthesis
MLQAVPDTDSGIIVPPECIRALADDMGALVDDVELSRKLGDSARSMPNKFSLEDVGRRLAQVLRRSTDDRWTPDKR